MLEQQFQIAFEAVSLVMCIGKNLHVGGLIQGVFDASQDRDAERIGNIEEHDADAMASLTAQKSRHRIRPVTKFLSHFLNALFCRRRDVTRQRRVVQHNRNRSRRKAAGLRDIPHRYGEVLGVSPFHKNWRLRGHHHPSRVAPYAMGPFELEASFRGRLKRYGFAEPRSLPGSINYSHSQPNGPKLFRRHTQMTENVAANSKNEPASAIAPINITLFAGMCRFGSILPKNPFGSASLRPIP